MVVYANLDSHEGVTNGETINLKLVSRKLIITNDSSIKDLKFKFNESEAFSTLKPTETISLDFHTKHVILEGVDVPYRIWSYG